ncbi:MAG: DUF2079 domain-containing protein [Oscillospiraceae bacterium]|nr:DUF2079 domain-containing protein [Oscillospiraceae bacterium]
MILKIKEKLNTKKILVLLFSSYLLVNTANIYVFRKDILDVENNANINLTLLILKTLALFAVLFTAYIFISYKNYHRIILFLSSVTYAVGLVTQKNLNIAFNAVVCAVLFYIINYCFREPDGISFNFLNSKTNFAAVLIFITAAAAGYTVIIGLTCILRFRIFAAASFDFGIFAQMFESMAKHGTQITTLERNMELSHFAVHFSPIYYLILPVYMLFRTPESLLIMQAALIASAVYPLALTAKKFNFTNINIIFISLAYLFYPAVTGGAIFDFHENKFLTALVLWLIYFIISERYIFIYIFAALTLAVKEDAFLYVLCTALYFTADSFNKNKKMTLHCAGIAVLSLVYFVFVTWFLNTHGHGVMIFRYELFLLWHEDGFFAIIRNIIKNPALLLSSLLSVPEKLGFVLYMLIPLCFMPFVCRSLKFIILIIPMIVMNLATNYIYQYDIEFQYTYGVAALLFFLFLKHLTELPRRHITKICVAAACFSCVLFMSSQYNRIHAYDYVYYALEEDFVETREILSRIPHEASVTATMFIPAHLSKNERVYAVDLYAEDFFDYDTDYLIIDTRGLEDWSRYREELDLIYQKGYRLTDAGGIIEVFRKMPDIPDITDD